MFDLGKDKGKREHRFPQAMLPSSHKRLSISMKTDTAFLLTDCRSTTTLSGPLESHPEATRMTLGLLCACNLCAICEGMYWMKNAWAISVVCKWLFQGAAYTRVSIYPGFPSEILLPSFISSSCSSYCADSWGIVFCCFSSCSTGVLCWG